MSIVLPINIDWNEWACQIRIGLPNISVPLPSPIEDWRSWASQLINSNELQNVPLPTEITYPNTEDWKKWAAYFVNSVYT